jgi:hypothetical protein
MENLESPPHSKTANYSLSLPHVPDPKPDLLSTGFLPLAETTTECSNFNNFAFLSSTKSLGKIRQKSLSNSVADEIRLLLAQTYSSADREGTPQNP